MQATLGEGEQFHRGTAEAAIQHAQNDINVWNLVFILSPEQWGIHGVELQTLGFTPSGNISVDNRVFLKLWKVVRRSPDGDTTGKWAPDIPASDVELQARALMEERYAKR